MKGIILAGGRATRLRPVTLVTSKQLLPIYNKPMIYYPIETLKSAGITEVLIIVAPDNAGDFLKLLGSGKEIGMKFSYEVQDSPNGLAEAFLVGENFIGDDDVTLILGDNYFDADFHEAVQTFQSGARVFACEVPDPHRYGVVEFDQHMKAVSIEEKPTNPKSTFAVTGFYIYDNSVIEKAKTLKPSARGELEITDINNLYLNEGNLDVALVKGKWMDTGTFESWFETSAYVRDKELQK
ncbi:MAG: sugar nucleotidyltransferase [Candidatus Gracilibacteria bacterium]